MKKLIKISIPFMLIITALVSVGTSCHENEVEPENNCNAGISYKLDGVLMNFDNTLVTAEIYNDAAIGKFYDIWTDENTGFYFHSTITEDGETAPYASDWFTTADVGNIIFLNNQGTVNVTFQVIDGANAVSDQVQITFSGGYDDTSGVYHTITDGVICTTIDIVH